MKKKISSQKAQKTCLDYYNATHEEYLEKFSDELTKKPYDQDFLRSFADQIKENGWILDIGCASTAQQARFFRDAGFKVTSIDLSENCIETARKNFKGIEFLQMDMLQMDFIDRTFDAINAFYSIIHIPDEHLPVLFSDLSNLLKPGGKLAIAVHAGDFYGYYDVEGTRVFFRTYAKDDLLRLLDHAGFRVLDVNQRQPLYDFEFQSERIYLIAEKN